ncbi:nuclear transport factor 2 family protein [Frateuria aurantia]
MDPAVQREILSGEEALIQAQACADTATVQRLLSDDFHEIGSSGRYFGKPAVIDSLTRSVVLDFNLSPREWIEVDDHCVILVYLAEVTRRRGAHRRTLRSFRSSTWRREAGVWRMLFHQGTPTTETEPPPSR